MASHVPDRPASTWKIVLPLLLLAAILWATFVLKLNNLDHSALTQWDEAHHAIVAQNVLKHPFKPTLIDVPYLPYDHKKWGDNHVWLHKPILPFWQVALSFAILGVNAFALRLPAAILSTAAAGLTYLIGKELFDRRTGLIAAVLQAVNPFLMTLVQGYQFADNIDVALLFWIEVAVYFLTLAMRTGSWRFLALAGVGQGMAFLCKSYLAGIVLGIALTAWLLPVCRLTFSPEAAPKFGLSRVLGLLATTALTVAPWLVYCAISYPVEFFHEEAQIRRHLTFNVENWGAPWDRVAFDYLIAIYGVFYTPVLMAAFALVGIAVARRHAGLWLMYAWGFGVWIPHFFAATKTPSATTIAIPAFLLLLGYLIAESSRGERWSLTALTAILFMSIVLPAVVKNPGHGYPSSRAFGGVLRQAPWVIYHVAGAFALVGIISVAWLVLRRRFAFLSRSARVISTAFCVGVLILLAGQTVVAAWRVTDQDLNDPVSVEVGTFAREHLPENAVLLCEEKKGYEHLVIMFYADRTCYALAGKDRDDLAERIIQADGIPYVVSVRRLPFVPVHICEKRGPTVYLWRR
jgi:4-amino-4-deoxy-L-arabinose transferase-like glycosyltransferase